MAQRNLGNSTCHVGDAGDAADFHSHMICCNGFARSAHAHSISTDETAHLHLGRRLVVGASQLDINTLLNRNIQCICGSKDLLPASLIVDFAHIWETRAKLVDVCANQRTRYKIGNLVFHHHEVASMEIRIQAARSVGEEQDLCSHHAHQAGGKHHVRHRIAFIVVNAPLHDDHRNTLNISEHEPALMAADSRNWKTFDFVIINSIHNFNAIRVVS